MPASGVSGTQRVNFAVPLARGKLLDGDLVRVSPAAPRSRPRAASSRTTPDGSVRSVQIQVQIPVVTGQVLQVRLGETPTTSPLTLAAVSTTLTAADGSLGPHVWALLPAAWLAQSGVAGPQVPEALTTGSLETGLGRSCDYTSHGITTFLPVTGTKDSWLFDRGTSFYRGYARRGDFFTLETAYRETALYRNGITGTGTSTRIGVPGSSDDLKYHYNQNLAIHYLLTGDDRFRESAEGVAARVAALWPSPGYAGGGDFWTERHAGFGLLAYVWADMVTDDHGTEFRGPRRRRRHRVPLDAGACYPASWPDANARCFAHTAAAARRGLRLRGAAARG